MSLENNNSSESKRSLLKFIPSESAQRATNHYQNELIAKRFASKAVGTATDRREKNCVLKALRFANIPAGASILDCPCGAGRMLPVLKERGYKITGADVSASMVDQARLYAGPQGKNCLKEEDKLVVADVFNTGFADKYFDAVMCHRLFQYFNESRDRQLALNELRRISCGPIIVSFSCSWSIDHWWYTLRRFFHLTRRRKCESISPMIFIKDINSCGLEVQQWIATRPFISKRWYAVLAPISRHFTIHDRIRSYRDIIYAGGRAAMPLSALIGSMLL